MSCYWNANVDFLSTLQNTLDNWLCVMNLCIEYRHTDLIGWCTVGTPLRYYSLSKLAQWPDKCQLDIKLLECVGSVLLMLNVNTIHKYQSGIHVYYQTQCKWSNIGFEALLISIDEQHAKHWPMLKLDTNI